ncbi:MAG: hypothetical protein KA757_07105, partial [Vogesella sp.]|nr:hypothetical protein [Vogesella sp.]
MFFFNKKRSSVPDNGSAAAAAALMHIVRTDNQGYDQALQAKASGSIKLVLGYVNPAANLEQVGRSVARHFPQAKVVLTTTAGELCSASRQDTLYLPANGQWQTMVFQLFDAALVSDVHVTAVPLACE